MNLRKTAGMLALSAAALTTAAVTASPAWGSVTPQACGLSADAPNSSLDGTGYRSGCSGTVTLTVEVYKDVWAALDIRTGYASRTNFGNGNLTADGGCSGRGSYYTYVLSSTGNDHQSGRVTRC